MSGCPITAAGGRTVSETYQEQRRPSTPSSSALSCSATSTVSTLTNAMSRHRDLPVRGLEGGDVGVVGRYTGGDEVPARAGQPEHALGTVPSCGEPLTAQHDPVAEVRGEHGVTE